MRSFLLLLSVFLVITTKSQTYVTIPDPNFASWLQTTYPSAMSGNQMNTSSPAITSAIAVIVPNKGITNLTGIQYFTSLQYLECEQNSLTNLPPLPSSLLYLWCYSNQLTSLPTLPPNLIMLNCGINQLSSLPALPSSLIGLRCDNNQLTALPSLPSTLDTLSCNYNSIAALPALPLKMTWVECSYNQISFITTIPDTIQGFLCAGNLLSALPALPASMFYFDCSINSLTTLPALSPDLQWLQCDSNNLAALPSLPASLTTLSCSRNQLTALPVLPASLMTLICGHNQLSALPTLPALYDLSCDHNNISCLPVLPSTINNTFDISANPISCLPNYIAVMSTQQLSIPLCSNGNTNACPNASGILGRVYLDNNSNCSMDTADTILRNIPLRLYNNSNQLVGQTYSAINGIYNFAKQNGTYKAVVDTAGLPFTVSCVYPGIDSTVAIFGLDSNVNFPLTCKPGFDIGVMCASPIGWVFPGQQHTLKINAGAVTNWYGVNCTAGISGQVQVTISGKVTYVGVPSGALVPTVAGNTFTYAINDFGTVNNNSDFRINLSVDTTAQAGDTICVTVNVTPVTGDNNPNNNTLQHCYLVSNSYDPNLKEVYPVDVPWGYQDWLTYTIHFQNTGNAPSFNIRIEDTLDSKLDLSTFQVTGYSHTNYPYLNGQRLLFYFPNINLPDSTSNPSTSMGYIQYRIKPKSTWTFPAQIMNRANIYFDYNPAILTNTTINSILTAVGIQETSPAHISVYPNPTEGAFTVTCGNPIDKIQVFNVVGEMVLEKKRCENNCTITIEAAGVYFARIESGKRSVIKKIVVR